ncbi:MAG: hypothetical protein V4613_11370 [Bacteroidota bacterium]
MQSEFKVRRLASIGAGILLLFAAFLFGYWVWEIGYIFWLTIFLSILSLFALTIASLVLFGFYAVSIDKTTNEWREYIAFLNLQLFTKVEPLPNELTYILIFEAIYRAKPFHKSERTYEGTDLYEVSVVYNDNRKKLFKLTVSKDTAIETAEALQKIFDLEIFDKTRY